MDGRASDDADVITVADALGLTPAQAAQLIEVWRLNGGQIGGVVTATPTARTAPGIVQVLTGPDGTGRSTMTRTS